MQGYEALRELSTIIVASGGAISGGGAGSSSAAAAASSGGATGVAAADMQRCYELSNRFYSIIPHTSEGARGTRTQLEAIANSQILKAKIEMVEALGNIELASRVIDAKNSAVRDVQKPSMQTLVATASTVCSHGGYQPHIQALAAAVSSSTACARSA